MKTFPLHPTVFSLALLLAACAKDDRLATIAHIIDQQNKTILDQQQALLDQQQKLIDQEIQLSILSSQLASDEDVLRKLVEPSVAAEPAKAASKVNESKLQIVRLLTGFNARLSANIGYSAYADALSDLNSNVTQALLDIKEQSFIDEVNHILGYYNFAGDFWQRFAAQGVAEITLTPTDRYKYANMGVNFVDSYNPSPSDVKKFWLNASDEIEKMLETNSTDLGRDGTQVVRLFGR